MKLTILHKLVLSLLGLTLVVLVATLGLARWSFERGFLDYVNALEQVRLQALATALEQDYIEGGNSWLALDGRTFRSRMQSVAPKSMRRGPRDRLEYSGAERRPPKGPSDNSLRGGPRPPPGPREAEGPLTALYTVEGKKLFGPSIALNREVMSVPVVVNGQTVGELRSVPHRVLNSPQATEFSQQQLHTSLLIGAAALGLAALVSVLLARLFLAPVRQVISNMNRLSNGDYDVRIHSKRSDELGLLARDFDRLAVTLEKNQTARKRWLADISHELRTPLTILHGELEALKDGVRTFNAQQLESFDQEVQRLRHLVNDLYELSVSDIGGLRYSFVLTDMRDCLEMAVESLRAGADAVGITIEIEIAVAREQNLMVLADRNRLEQLFRNLLRNSLAYTDSPGLVQVHVAKAGGTVVIDINDTAPGATQAECELLFDPLYRQEQSRNRRSAGAGLGLSICKNIVEAHRGNISAAPSKLGGLAIHIEMPVGHE